MNDSKKVKVEKTIKDVKIKDKKDVKYIIEITDENVDIGGKKNGDVIDIPATIKEDKKDATTTPLSLKAKVNIGWYGDSITFEDTDNATYKMEGGERKIYSARMHKPVLWITIAVVALAIIGLIWWWIASSKKEDKEEESL